MKLADISHGSDMVIWIIFGIFTALSILLLFGRGSWLIAGYNTAPKEEKEKYDTKNYAGQWGLVYYLYLPLFLLWNCSKISSRLASHISRFALSLLTVS